MEFGEFEIPTSVIGFFGAVRCQPRVWSRRYAESDSTNRSVGRYPRTRCDPVRSVSLLSIRRRGRNDRFQTLNSTDG